MEKSTRFQNLDKTNKNKTKPKKPHNSIKMSVWIILFVISTHSIMTANYMPEVTLQAEAYTSFFPFS